MDIIGICYNRRLDNRFQYYKHSARPKKKARLIFFILAFSSLAIYTFLLASPIIFYSHMNNTSKIFTFNHPQSTTQPSLANDPNVNSTIPSLEQGQIYQDLETGQISSGMQSNIQARNKPPSETASDRHSPEFMIPLNDAVEAQNSGGQSWSSSNKVGTNCVSQFKQTQKNGIEQKIQYEINSHDHRFERFSLRIWVRHQVLRKINDSLVFRQIQTQTQIAYVYYDFNQKVFDEKGAVIQLYDQQQTRVQKALLMLVKKIRKIEKSLFFDEYNMDLETCTIFMLVPRILVPLVMGKGGKLIHKMKDYSNSTINVHGLYQTSIFQPIQVCSDSLKSSFKCCCVINTIVYKALKSSSVQIEINTINKVTPCRLGIILTPQMEKTAFHSYFKLMDTLQKSLNINIKKYTTASKNQAAYMFRGQMQKLKEFLGIFLRFLQLGKRPDQPTEFIMSEVQAKMLTSFSGKFLRDISNKCEDCYFRVNDKDPIDGDYKLLAKGSQTGKIRAAIMLLQLFSFGQTLIENQRRKFPIDYESLLIEKFRGINQWEEPKGQEQSGSCCHQDELYCSKKTKFIAKAKKEVRYLRRPSFRIPQLKKINIKQLSEKLRQPPSDKIYEY